MKFKNFLNENNKTTSNHQSTLNEIKMRSSVDKEDWKVYEKRAEHLKDAFLEEVDRLLYSGGIAKNQYSTVIKVALENLADNERENNTKDYKNLKKF